MWKVDYTRPFHATETAQEIVNMVINGKVFLVKLLFHKKPLPQGVPLKLRKRNQ